MTACQSRLGGSGLATVGGLVECGQPTLFGISIYSPAVLNREWRNIRGVERLPKNLIIGLRSA